MFANTFSTFYVIDKFNRPETEGVDFWAQATSVNCEGVCEFDVIAGIFEALHIEWDYEMLEHAFNRITGMHVAGDDFGRLEIFEIADCRNAFGIGGPKSVYVEVYYPDPECEMPERYADEVEPFDDLLAELVADDIRADNAQFDQEGKFLFWFDDAYGQERMFTFKGTRWAAIARAKELCGDGADCLTVENCATGERIFDEHDYYSTFEVDEHAHCYTPFWG